MTLPQLIEAYHNTTELSEEEAVASLDTLFGLSSYLDIDQFTRQNITQTDAESITLSNEHFISEYLKYHESPLKVITPTIAEHSIDLAQYLAVSEPAIATQLLGELLYWREKGHI